MDPAIVGALSAVLGSVVGGTASIAAAWFTQRAEGRRESINAEIARRELVYTDFIAECSKLLIDAFDHTLDSPATLIQVYALLSRIRLMSSDAVVIAAEQTLDKIIDRYSQPNLTTEETIKMNPIKRREDTLRSFSEACRNELRQFKPMA